MSPESKQASKSFEIPANHDVHSPTRQAQRSLAKLGYNTDLTKKNHHHYRRNDEVYLCSHPVNPRDTLTVLAIGFRDKTSPHAVPSYVYAVRATDENGETEILVLREKDIVARPEYNVGSIIMFTMGEVQLPVRVAEVWGEGGDWMYRFDGSEQWRGERKIKDLFNN